MAPRANWKGYLKLGDLSCAVALYTAASTSGRVAFHMVNRATGHRLQREFVDSETGKSVERDDQVKGYETSSDDYVVLEPEEIAGAVPKSDKTLDISAFLACGDIDDIFFDKPYYLAPAGRDAQDAFAIFRDGMRAANVAAIAHTVLFRRMRTVLIRAHGDGLIATTLNFDYEVRSAEEAFADISDIKINDEMLDLAEHIISKKSGSFAPSKFDDRYDAALAEVVRAKIEGRKIRRPPQPKEGKVIDLMEALRQSAGKTAAKPAKRKTTKKASGKGAKTTRKAS